MRLHGGSSLARRAALGVVGCFVLGASLASAGCATAVRDPLARRPEGLPSANRGQSSAVVFAGPAVAAAMQDTPEWTRPEYARNDDNLAYAPTRALTAIDEWPQVPPPTALYPVRTFINPNPQQIIIFARPGRGGWRGFGPPVRRPTGGFYVPRPR